MARNETEARRYKTLAMVKLEQRSYASALSYLKKARRNYNKLDALDNLEAVILVRSGEEQGRQDSLCGPWGDSQGYKSRDQEGVQKDHSSCPSGQMFGVSTCSN
ncbi:hypothetical protein Tco_0756611, partial [Tanacetum coccineum]